MNSCLVSLPLLLSASLAAQGDLDLVLCGASLGRPMEVRLERGTPNSAYLLFFSGNAGPIYFSAVDPTDPRHLKVGLDLVPLLRVGVLDSTGRSSFSFPLPADNGLAGVRIHSHGVLFPGTRYLLGGITNDAVTVLDQGGVWKDRNLLLGVGRAYVPPIQRPDGTVLLPGGGTGAMLAAIGLKTSEVFDPRTQSWFYGPNLTIERALHTVTQLRDGRSLIVNGVDVNNDPQTTCEFYDPVPDVFSTAPATADKRAGHAAVMLPTGKVLVSGGLSDLNNQLAAIGSALDTTEIYDPGTNMWSRGPRMSHPRAGHTMHLLANGKVLIVGGVSWDLVFVLRVPRFLREVDLYDSVANTITKVNPMATPRGLHSATELADGRLFVAGGPTDILSGGAPTNTAEIYDPSNGQWTAAGNMAKARGLHGAGRLNDGKVLLAGGADGSLLLPNPLTECEIFDPATRSFSPAPSLVTPRAGFPLVELQGCVWYAVSGGGTGSTMTRSTEFFYR